MSSPRRSAALLAACAAIVVLSSCGTATKTTAADHGAQPSSAAEAHQVAGQGDVLFAQAMIPHHRQAITLAKLVPDRSSNPDLVKLAARLNDEQQPEINFMRALLVQWEASPAEAPGESDHAGADMHGMVDDATMAKLKGLNGPQFDALWLQSMIDHHRGAIEMAKTEVVDGENSDLVALAKRIVTAQQTEIDQMKQMQKAVGG